MLSDPNYLVLIGFSVLLIKHYICDFLLQTAYQYQNKGIYGHPGGFLHAGLHVLATTAVFFVIAPGLLLGLGILLGELVIHYHLDFTKEQIIKRNLLTVSDKGYWWALGADQLCHHLTYLGIMALLAGRLA